MMDKYLMQLEPRILFLALSVILVMTPVGAYLYLFKNSIHHYAQLKELRGASKREVALESQAVNSEQLQRISAQIETAQTRLYGKKLALAPNQMVSYVIGQLDQLALRHGIGLVSVKPGNQSQVLSFSEVPFDVEVTGRYFDLFAWLQDAERELRPMVVKQFQLIPQPQEKQLQMSLRVVSYQPLEGAPR